MLIQLMLDVTGASTNLSLPYSVFVTGPPSINDTSTLEWRGIVVVPEVSIVNVIQYLVYAVCICGKE